MGYVGRNERRKKGKKLKKKMGTWQVKYIDVR